MTEKEIHYEKEQSIKKITQKQKSFKLQFKCCFLFSLEKGEKCQEQARNTINKQDSQF